MAMGSASVPTFFATTTASTAVGGEGDGEVQVGFGEPVAAEVAGMNHACDFFSAMDIFFGHVVGFGLQDEAVHGVRSAPGFLPMLLAGRVMVWPCHSVVRVLPSADSLPRMRLG